jgi:hypothetical protein
MKAKYINTEKYETIPAITKYRNENNKEPKTKTDDIEAVDNAIGTKLKRPEFTRLATFFTETLPLFESAKDLLQTSFETGFIAVSRFPKSFL